MECEKLHPARRMRRMRRMTPDAPHAPHDAGCRRMSAPLLDEAGGGS
jgi:hypothetical protein